MIWNTIDHCSGLNLAQLSEGDIPMLRELIKRWEDIQMPGPILKELSNLEFKPKLQTAKAFVSKFDHLVWQHDNLKDIEKLTESVRRDMFLHAIKRYRPELHAAFLNHHTRFGCWYSVNATKRIFCRPTKKQSDDKNLHYIRLKRKQRRRQ